MAQHGSGGYTNLGCRCAVCRKAHRDYAAMYRTRLGDEARCAIRAEAMRIVATGSSGEAIDYLMAFVKPRLSNARL